MLSHLIYVSNRKADCTEKEIENILSSCKKNNPPMNITGVLLYSDRKFIQLVEGDSRTIMDLYNKIKLDSRHEKARMISYGPIKEKSFPSWHMASRNLSNQLTYHTEMSADDQVVFDRLLTGEAEDGSKVLTVLKKFF